MNKSLTLGKIMGIPFRVNAGWLVVAFLLTVSLATGTFPSQYFDWSVGTYWAIGIVTAVAFFASVLLHELGHSVIARREGIPVRSITLFIFGGVAEISREPDTPGAEFRIAIAGPLTSLLLAVLFFILSPIIAWTSAPLAASFSYLARVNVLLAVFNMIPGFPLDGGRVFRAILWHFGENLFQATRWATKVGRGIAYLFIAFGLLQIVMGNPANGIWIAFVGWFLNGAARSGYRHVVLKEALTGVPARTVLAQPCSVVSSHTQLNELLATNLINGDSECFSVTREGDLEGIVTLDNIRSVPRSEWRSVSASEVMTPVHALDWVLPDEDAWTLLQRMEQAHLDYMAFRDDGNSVGLLTREGIFKLLRRRLEFGY